MLKQVQHDEQGEKGAGGFQQGEDYPSRRSASSRPISGSSAAMSGP